MFGVGPNTLYSVSGFQGRCSHQQFADGNQLHQSSAPSDFHSLIVDVEQCVYTVERWMTGKRFKLNSDKPEDLLVGSRTRVRVSQDNHLTVDNHESSFKGLVKNLVVYFHTMVKHTDYISRSAYLEIRRNSFLTNIFFMTFYSPPPPPIPPFSAGRETRETRD